MAASPKAYCTFTTACGLDWARKGLTLDRRSRLVAFFRVILPLAALALMSTLFLLSRGTETDGVIPFAETTLEDRLSGQQVTEPFFSGTTDDGDEIVVMARSVRSGDGQSTVADGFFGRVRTADGKELVISSNTGQMRPGSDRVTFLGNVILEDATGITVKTDTLISALNRLDAEAPQYISGEAIFGAFSAGSMILTSPGPKDVRLVFKNGVNLIYRPKPGER